MRKEMKDIIISNGKVIKSWSRWTGTGYKSSIVEHEHNGKCYQIDYNCHSADGFYHNVVECSDPRPAQKEYFQSCLKTAKAENLPVELVMAVGVTSAKDFAKVAEGIKKVYLQDKLHELIECGITRRKAAIKAVISSCYDEDKELFAKIDSMGQVNSQRVANFLATEIKKVKSWEF